MQFAPATQPESNWDVIKRGWNLYNASFSHVFILALSLSVVAFLPRLVSFALGTNIVIALPPYSPHRLWFTLIDIVCLIFFTCIMWRIRCFVLGKHERITEDFNVAFHKWPLILVASIIQTLLYFILLITITSYFSYLAQTGILFKTNPVSICMVILPAAVQLLFNVYVFFLLLFYLPLIVTENSTIIGSLKRSAELVWRNWWRVFYVQTFPWFCYVLVIILIKVVTHFPIHLYFFQVNKATLSGLYTHLFIFGMFIPWWATSLIVQLHDLELRKTADKII